MLAPRRSLRCPAVRWGSKTLAAALVALLLALALGACGSGSGSTASEATTTSTKGGEEAEGATSFKPMHHHDSGGGSAQYRVKGGDNSIQEFGSEAEESEFAQAAAALHDFLDARAQGAWAAACSFLSKSTAESLEKLASRSKPGGGSCAAALGQVINPAAKGLMKEEAAKADVGSLRVEGERGFLIFTGAEKTVVAMPVTREGGAWKVASIAGTPIS